MYFHRVKSGLSVQPGFKRAFPAFVEGSSVVVVAVVVVVIVVVLLVFNIAIVVVVVAVVARRIHSWWSRAMFSFA